VRSKAHHGNGFRQRDFTLPENSDRGNGEASGKPRPWRNSESHAQQQTAPNTFAACEENDQAGKPTSKHAIQRGGEQTLAPHG
jgi:hypothetical protein